MAEAHLPAFRLASSAKPVGGFEPKLSKLRCQVLVVGCGPAGGELAGSWPDIQLDVAAVDRLPICAGLPQ